MRFGQVVLLAAGFVAAQQANAQTQITDAGSIGAAPTYGKWCDAAAGTTHTSLNWYPPPCAQPPWGWAQRNGL